METSIFWTDRETEQLRILRREIEKAWGISKEEVRQ